MTNTEITQRFLSDIRFVRLMHENGLISRFEMDETIERINLDFDAKLEMLAISVTEDIVPMINEWYGRAA